MIVKKVRFLQSSLERWCALLASRSRRIKLYMLNKESHRASTSSMHIRIKRETLWLIMNSWKECTAPNLRKQDKVFLSKVPWLKSREISIPTSQLLLIEQWDWFRLAWLLGYMKFLAFLLLSTVGMMPYLPSLTTLDYVFKKVLVPMSYE